MSSKSKHKSKDKKSRSSSEPSVHFFQKSPSTQVRIDIWSPEKEPTKTFVNIREWVKTAKDPEYRPTPKGLVVDPELWAEFQGLVAGFVPNGKQKKVEPLESSDSSSSEEPDGEVMYAVFHSGPKVLPTKQMLKAFQGTVDGGLAVADIKKLKPTRDFVVYKATVKRGKVRSVSRHATYAKNDGVRSWQKL